MIILNMTTQVLFLCFFRKRYAPNAIKREKHPWWSVTFSKVAGLTPMEEY